MKRYVEKTKFIKTLKTIKEKIVETVEVLKDKNVEYYEKENKIQELKLFVKNKRI
jgi:hypothetical protein